MTAPSASSEVHVFSGFGVVVSFADDEVVAAIWGEVDIVSAPDLAGMLDAVIDQGHRRVVLEMAHMSFMDVSGVRLIAEAAERLGPLGGELVIRSAPERVHRMLDVTDLADQVRFEDASLVDEHLGREQTGDDGTVSTMTGWPAPGQALRRMTAVPADNEVVDGALRMVVALARATVGGADGVSVSLRRHGRLATVAASDQTISDMDADQYATGEGPCVDASLKGRWFHVESLGKEDRWPAFTPRARRLGIEAILSSPLTSADRPVGSLNIYSRKSGAFAPKDQKIAAVLATQASAILTSAGLGTSEGQLVARLADALRAREVISQAVGVIMEREGVSDQDAYTLLRRFSQQSGRPLRLRAEDVVGSGRRAGPAQAVPPRTEPGGGYGG